MELTQLKFYPENDTSKALWNGTDNYLSFSDEEIDLMYLMYPPGGYKDGMTPLLSKKSHIKSIMMSLSIGPSSEVFRIRSESDYFFNFEKSWDPSFRFSMVYPDMTEPFFSPRWDGYKLKCHFDLSFKLNHQTGFFGAKSNLLQASHYFENNTDFGDLPILVKCVAYELCVIEDT